MENEKDIAQRVRDALRAFNLAVETAQAAGLDVEIDTVQVAVLGRRRASDQLSVLITKVI